MRSGKQHMTEGVEILNQVLIRTLWEKKTYVYLGIFEGDTIRKQKMKEKIKRVYLRKLLEIKHYRRKFVKGINTRAVPW